MGKNARKKQLQPPEERHYLLCADTDTDLNREMRSPGSGLLGRVSLVP